MYKRQITDKATYQDEQYQNQLDAETIYFLLEHNILPLYYERKEKDYQMCIRDRLRHGESLWNKENRFTGWTDVDLSDKGIAEACKAGDMLKEAGFSFEAAYTSYLKRAVKTLNCVLDRLNEDWIPVEKSWRLNEKHYCLLYTSMAVMTQHTSCNMNNDFIVLLLP